MVPGFRYEPAEDCEVRGERLAKHATRHKLQPRKGLPESLRYWQRPSRLARGEAVAGAVLQEGEGGRRGGGGGGEEVGQWPFDSFTKSAPSCFRNAAFSSWYRNRSLWRVMLGKIQTFTNVRSELTFKLDMRRWVGSINTTGRFLMLAVPEEGEV
jgi:hypothetical protein